MGTLATRVGGAFGVLAVLAMIPALTVGSPDQPHTPDEARRYFEDGSTFVTANGVVPLLHILFGVLPLVHTWLPLWAAVSTLVWVGLIGLVMLIAAKSTTPASIEARAASV